MDFVVLVLVVFEGVCVGVGYVLDVVGVWCVGVVGVVFVVFVVGFVF